MKKKKNLLDNNLEDTKQFDAVTKKSIIFDTNEYSDEFKTTEKEETMKKKKVKKPKKVNPNRKKASKLTTFFAVILGTISTGFIIGLVVLAVMVSSVIVTTPKIDASTFDKSNSTVVLDSEDNVIYNLGEKLIENVEYNEISQSLIDAFVSIEDSRFFKHNGFDLPRFANAMIGNLISSLTSLSLSFDAGGASTIDMQLVRNAVFTKENVTTGEVELPDASGLGGIKRKISEIYLANQINSNKILDKKVIIQKYVNSINYGASGNTLGVQKAAKYYFNKDTSDLTLIESAFLAGVVNAPNAYTPYNSIRLATERTHIVLNLMNFHGYITQDELDLALSVPLENIFVEQLMSGSDALPNQAYIDIVLDEVEELTGLNPAVNSMIIKTAMNPKLQKEYDRAQNREIDYLNIQSRYDTEMQLAATVIDNATGEIIASFGGYDYYGQRILNRSYHGLYQPGSTVKPIISYAPAFEYLGYSTSHVVLDEPYKWSGTDIPLQNWNRRYHGQVGIIEAVAQSYNIPAVKTFDAVEDHIGISRYTDYAEAIGFTRYAEKLDSYYEATGDSRKGRDAFTSQFAIGGNEFYTNTTELAGATAAIMNGGDYIKPHTIREVELLDTGEVIKSPHKKTPLLSEGAAYLTAHLMRNVIDTNRHGDVERYVARSYPVYAKTGTSNYSARDAQLFNVPSGSGKDRLLLTATDRFSIASWSGFDPDYVSKKDGKAYHSGALKSFQIQARINSFTLDELASQYGPGVAIKQPSSVKKIEHIIGTFPYQAPIEGMNPDLITSGLVKAEFASLAPATPPELDEFQGADAKLTQENDIAYIDVTYNGYPDPTKLIKAPVELETGGKRLYDPSWIFGPVRYTTEVFVDDKLVETIKTEEPLQNIRIHTADGSKLRVCTFYSFELRDDITTKKTCQEFKLEESLVEIPRFSGQKLPFLQDFAQKHGSTVNTSFTKTSNRPKDFLAIDKVNGLPDGKKVKPSELSGKTWDADLFDVLITNLNSISPNELQETLSQYINISISGSGSKITGFESNGETIPSLRVSDFYNTDRRVVILTD